jgi:hypothetical protein
MSKDREQSAVDAIYELLDEVRELRKEIKIIDGNVKLLNNKISKAAVSATPSIQPSNSSPKPSAAAPSAAGVSVPKEVQLVKLFGRIKNQSRKPIKGVYIKIFDPSGNAVKSRETDSEGYWEARVIPGHYVVELNATHINKNFLPKNINIFVEDNLTEYEVK